MVETSRFQPGFDIYAGKGFTITFENGWTISVQFGRGNYCENRFEEGHTYVGRSSNAEVAVFDPDDNYIKLPDRGYEVEGWCTPAEVLKHMTWVANR